MKGSDNFMTSNVFGTTFLSFCSLVCLWDSFMLQYKVEYSIRTCIRWSTVRIGRFPFVFKVQRILALWNPLCI